MNILIVDDSATMRMIVIKSLRQAGFESANVIEAGGAKEALQKIAAGGIDLDRKSTRLNSSHSQQSRMPSSA